MRHIPKELIVPLIFVDIGAFSLVFGATIYFFFIQTPFLLKFMGSEKFVPLQMKLTGRYFFYVQIPLLISVIVTMVLAHNYNSKGLVMMASAILGGIAGLVNKSFVVPNALEEGAKSINLRQGV